MSPRARLSARALARLVIATGLAGLLAGLAACRPRPDAPDTASSSSPVVIHYWEKWSGREFDTMREIVEDFNRGQSAVEVRLLSVSQIDTKLMLATSAGNPPDLAGLWSHSIPDFAEKGALRPLDRALAEAGIDASAYEPAFWSLCAHRGFVWGLPTTPASTALFFNRALFREAGLDPDRPPATLAELEAMNERLTIVAIRRGDAVRRVRYSDLAAEERAARRFTVVQVGHLPQEPGWWLPLWGAWFGSALTAGEFQLSAIAPGNVAAYAWMRASTDRLGVENLRAFGSGFGNFSSPLNPFLSGSVAMVMQGPWMHNFIEKYAPSLDWGIAPFPGAVAGAPPVTIVESDVIVLPRGSAHPREAMRFVAHLQRPEVAERLALGQRKFTALRRVSEDFYARHPNPRIRDFVALARSPGAVSAPRLSVWREYETELRVAGERVVNLSATPADALAQAQARVQRRLDRTEQRWRAIGPARLEEWRNDESW